MFVERGTRVTATRELFWLRLFAGDHRFVGAIRISGTSDHVDIPIAPIARAVARMDAAYIRMSHNHPSGDVRPSAADIEATRRVWRMARSLGISLQDHVITGSDEPFSFRANGLL